MANIPFLHGQRRADGTVAWHWKPSPRLRKAGWTNRLLGTDQKAALLAAIELNEQVQAWGQGAATVADAKPVPRAYTFQDLVDAYRASPEYRTDIEASTRREYDSRLQQLVFWADDGRLRIRSIDSDMVKDLRKALLAERPDGTMGSKFKCAAMLRVLRLLCRWAVDQRLLSADPTVGVPIPTPPSRTHKLDWRAVNDMAHAPDTGAQERLMLLLAFWTLQRREDLCGMNRMMWRELHGADPRDLPVLVNGKGQVWGLRLQQHKTKRWVDCPLPAWLHQQVEDAFAANGQFLFPHHADPAKHLSGDVARRRIKPLLVAAGFPDHQLRDFRRSGMSWMKDMGAMPSDVFAISGHSLLGNQRTIADTYMPPDTRSACAAIAAAERTRRALEAREQEESQ